MTTDADKDALIADMAEAIRHLVDDAENHEDGDDRSLTLDVTIRRARIILVRADAYLKAKDHE